MLFSARQSVLGTAKHSETRYTGRSWHLPYQFHAGVGSMAGRTSISRPRSKKTFGQMRMSSGIGTISSEIPGCSWAISPRHAPIRVAGRLGPDYGLDMHDSNQPVLRVLPASLEIFAEGTEPTPMDDFEAIIRSHELIAQAECPCRATDKAWGIPNKQAVCPKCNCYLSHISFLGDYKGKRITYCETCGQAIDWEGWDWDE